MNTHSLITYHDILIGDVNQERNTIIYWCDGAGTGHTLKTFHYSLMSVLGPTTGTDVSPSECLWMFPLWDCFEQASV